MRYAITEEAKGRLVWYEQHDPPMHRKIRELIDEIKSDPMIGADQGTLIGSDDPWQVRVAEALMRAKFDVPPNTRIHLKPLPPKTAVSRRWLVFTVHLPGPPPGHPAFASARFTLINCRAVDGHGRLYPKPRTRPTLV